MGHHPGMAMASDGIGNAPLPGWAIVLVLAVVAVLAYFGWRWWHNLNKPAF